MTNITAIVAVALGCVVAAVVITWLRPNDDNIALITIIFGSGVSTIAGLLSMLKSVQNSAELTAANEKLAKTDTKLNTLAITVDGRLTQLLEARTEAAHSAGMLTGQQDERDRASVPAPTPAHGTPISNLGPRIVEAPVIVVPPKRQLEPPDQPKAGPGDTQ